jgi:hypothetical protein
VKVRVLLPIICLMLFAGASYGQSYFRIEADVSMKTKPTDGKGQLILGRVYYDRTHRKMVYDIRFPEHEVWVMRDSMAYTFRDSELVRTDTINPFIESTVFHKCLEGKLADFGLKDTFYKVTNIEKQDDMVITTWNPPPDFIFKGSILTSSIDNLLHGVVILNEEEKVLSRQVFKDYALVSGLKIPTEMIQVMYIDDQEIYQTITLSNIRINNMKDETFYNHPVN